MLAIRANEPLWQDGPYYVPAEEIAAALPADRWQRLSAGMGAKGPPGQVGPRDRAQPLLGEGSIRDALMPREFDLFA